MTSPDPIRGLRASAARTALLPAGSASRTRAPTSSCSPRAGASGRRAAFCAWSRSAIFASSGRVRRASHSSSSSPIAPITGSAGSARACRPLPGSARSRAGRAPRRRDAARGPSVAVPVARIVPSAKATAPSSNASQGAVAREGSRGVGATRARRIVVPGTRAAQGVRPAMGGASDVVQPPVPRAARSSVGVPLARRAEWVARGAADAPQQTCRNPWRPQTLSMAAATVPSTSVTDLALAAKAAARRPRRYRRRPATRRCTRSRTRSRPASRRSSRPTRVTWRPGARTGTGRADGPPRADGRARARRSPPARARSLRRPIPSARSWTAGACRTGSRSGRSSPVGVIAVVYEAAEATIDAAALALKSGNAVLLRRLVLGHASNEVAASDRDRGRERPARGVDRPRWRRPGGPDELAQLEGIVDLIIRAGERALKKPISAVRRCR